MRHHRLLWTAALSFAMASFPALASGQGTLADYERAATIQDRFDGLTVGLVQGGPNWIDGTNDFSYRVTVADGARYVVVESASTTKRPAFDHERLATSLSAAAGSGLWLRPWGRQTCDRWLAAAQCSSGLARVKV